MSLLKGELLENTKNQVLKAGDLFHSTEIYQLSGNLVLIFLNYDFIISMTRDLIGLSRESSGRTGGKQGSFRIPTGKA